MYVKNRTLIIDIPACVHACVCDLVFTLITCWRLMSLCQTFGYLLWLQIVFHWVDLVPISPLFCSTGSQPCCQVRFARLNRKREPLLLNNKPMHGNQRCILLSSSYSPNFFLSHSKITQKIGSWSDLPTDIHNTNHMLYGRLKAKKIP